MSRDVGRQLRLLLCLADQPRKLAPAEVECRRLTSGRAEEDVSRRQAARLVRRRSSDNLPRGRCKWTW